MTLGQKMMLKLAPKPQSQEAFLEVDFARVKPLLNVRLVDYKFASGRDYIDIVRMECVELIRQINRVNRELKDLRVTLSNPKTLARERQPILDKMTNLSIGLHYSEQSLTVKLQNMPFSRSQLSSQLGAAFYGDDPEKYKPSKREIEIMAEQARLARNVLGIQVIEARALKNRLNADTIQGIIQAY